MAKYVSLFRYTGAIEGGGPERMAKVQQLVAAENCEIVATYGLLGAYDLVGITECPDNQTAMELAAMIGNLIGAKSETMPAVDQNDFLQMLTEL